MSSSKRKCPVRSAAHSRLTDCVLNSLVPTTKHATAHTRGLHAAARHSTNHQDDLYAVMPLISIMELLVVLLYLGHFSGCFFYLLSTPPYQTACELCAALPGWPA